MIRESLENKRIQMGIIITLLAIGFAAVATNLFINGTAKIGFSELDVYYSRAVINGEEDNSVITSRRVIEFETPVMTTLGEKYTLEYDVTNGSKNYDAKLQMNCTSDGNEFVSIKNTFNLDDLLKARTTRSGILVIKLIKPSTEDRTFNIQCQIDAEPIEREEPGGDEIVKEPKTLVETIMSKANDDSINEYDAGDKGEVYAFQHEETAQLKANTDYRFIGDVPNNYIIYDNDLFRIIGVFEDEDGIKRAKIVRDNYAKTVDDTSFKWNDQYYSQASATKPNELIYNTNWPDSELYNSYTKRVLTEGALEHADIVRWYLGASNSITESTTDYYNDERSNNVYGNNDKYIDAQVGLLNVSDYFYTYAYGVNDKCFNIPGQCAIPPSNQGASWLYKGSNEHFLNTMSDSQSVFILKPYGSDAIINQAVTSLSYIRDVVYLKPDTVSLKGDGSKDNPYTIESHDSTDFVTSFKNESLVSSDKIEKLVFVDSPTVPEDAIVSWDASNAQNGSIMEYTLDEDKNGMYELYIGKVGKVYTNHYTQNLFSFKNATKIENIEKFSTKNVKNMYFMFWGSGFIELDLSHFDTSAVQTFNNMFSQCKNLVSVKLENWDTKNAADMISMFNSCESLKELDLSQWDTSNLQKMYSMFEYCYAIEKINLHGWKTDKVSEMRQLFNYCQNLKELDISTFNTVNVTNMSYMFEKCDGLISLNLEHFNNQSLSDISRMFYGCSNLVDLKLGNNFFPVVNYASYLFYDCSKLNTTILLPHGFSQWTAMFVNTSIEEGAKTVLNYKSEAEAFVDAMIIQKDSNINSRGTANVVKGELIA